MPQRIQRKRIKGWRMPASTVYVGRGTAWGNPWRVADVGRQEAVRRFRCIASDIYSRDDLNEIKGLDLACWCRLDQPCHADVLLEIANR
jgi:hypothetical protein